MTDIVRDAIAASVAQLTRVVRVPDVVGYGSDLRCVDDIDPRAVEIDPNSTESLSQDLYHRATTDRGSVPDDPDFGENVLAWLSEGMTPEDLAAHAGALAGEFRKDDRVDLATVTVTAPDLKSLLIVAEITPADPDANTFRMVVAVTDGKALLQTVTET